MRTHDCLLIVGGEAGGRWTGGFGRQLRAVALSPFVGQRLTMLASKEHHTHIEEVSRFIEADQVAPIIDRTYPLAEVPDAMRHLEAGHAREKIALVELPPGATCCNGIVTASAQELPHRQDLFPGTTGWRISYNRRQVVEGVNGMLKGGFVNIQHKFFRVFGLTKTKLLLAFTVVGYNLEAIRSFLAKKSAKAVAAAKNPGRRKKRRKGTWTQVLGSPDRSTADPSGSGRAPPPTLIPTSRSTRS